MKKVVLGLLIAVTLQTTVFADFKDITYDYETEYKQTLSTGLEYLGYSGLLKFSVTDTDYESVGAEMTFDDEVLEYNVMNLCVFGLSESGNYQLRIKGRGLMSGNYTITPYIIKNGVKVYSQPIDFEITGSCVAMTNLRIAYDQISELIESQVFNNEELKIVDYIMDVAKNVIADGEAGNEITKKYIAENYSEEAKTVEQMYNALGSKKYKFAGKFNSVETKARSFILTEFGLMGKI